MNDDCYFAPSPTGTGVLYREPRVVASRARVGASRRGSKPRAGTAGRSLASSHGFFDGVDLIHGLRRADNRARCFLDHVAIIVRHVGLQREVQGCRLFPQRGNGEIYDVIASSKL